MPVSRRAVLKRAIAGVITLSGCSTAGNPLRKTHQSPINEGTKVPCGEMQTIKTVASSEKFHLNMQPPNGDVEEYVSIKNVTD